MCSLKSKTKENKKYAINNFEESNNFEFGGLVTTYWKFEH